MGVLISALAQRRPWKFARETASLDVLSGGRLVVGVDLGSQGREEFAAFGEDPDLAVRAARLDEGLEILLGLWSGEPYAFQGRHHSGEETVFVPRPCQRPRPPIWVAGRWPARRPFRRAARFDGVFPTFEGFGPFRFSDARAATSRRDLHTLPSRPGSRSVRRCSRGAFGRAGPRARRGVRRCRSHVGGSRSSAGLEAPSISHVGVSGRGRPRALALTSRPA